MAGYKDMVDNDRTDPRTSALATLQDAFATWLLSGNGAYNGAVRELRDECGMEERAAVTMAWDAIADVVESGNAHAYRI